MALEKPVNIKVRLTLGGKMVKLLARSTITMSFNHTNNLQNYFLNFKPLYKKDWLILTK